MTSANDTHWLTLGQACARLAELNVKDQTIRAWADEGVFGKVKRTRGGHRRIPAAGVSDYLAKWRAEQREDTAAATDGP